MCLTGHRKTLRGESGPDLPEHHRWKLFPHDSGLQLKFEWRELRSNVPTVNRPVLHAESRERLQMTKTFVQPRVLRS